MLKKLLSSIGGYSKPSISLNNGKHEITFSTTTDSFECIKIFLENGGKEQLITRLELSNLIEGELKESALNEEVQSHIISIIPTLINLAFQYNQQTLIFQHDILTDLSRSDNLQQAVLSISHNKYYNALTHILDYLLSNKDLKDSLSFMEVYIVYTLLNSILFNTLKNTDA